jgi:ATP-dependent protease ClpP protease subunit/2'-5' RNA ligase
MNAMQAPMTGAMIALAPSIQDAARLAVDGGECPTQLHTTLVYLGEAADIPDEARAQILDAVQAYAEGRAPIEADGFALSVFNPGDATDRETCIALGLSGAGLDPAHDAILAAVTDVAGLDLPPQHAPWTPHTTLIHTDDVAQVAALTDRVGPVTFDRIRVAFADDVVDVLLGKVVDEPDDTNRTEAPAGGTPTNADVTAPRAEYNPGQPRDHRGWWTDGMPEVIASDTVKLLGGDITVQGVARDDEDHGWIRISDGTYTANVGGSYATALDLRMTDLREEMDVGETQRVIQGERQEDGSYLSVPLYAVTKTGRARYELKIANPDDTLESLTERRGVEMTYKQFQDVVDSAQMMSAARRVSTDGGPVDFYPDGDSRVGVRVKDVHGDVREMSFSDKEWAKISHSIDVVRVGQDETEQAPDDAPDDWDFTPVSEVQIPTSVGMLVVVHADDRLTIAPLSGDDWHITWPADRQHPIWEALDDVETTVGVDKHATNTARLLPIRAFTMPSGADRTDMGRATRAREARMRARADQQTWYRIENKTSPDTAEVYLYSEIGMWGVSADMFAREMSEVKAKTINLHINSPGGEVFDGVAIYNTLKNHPARIEVSIDGLAASAASFIACAGDRIVIMRHAQMMIHDAAGFCMGNGKDMSSMADLLESLSDTIADIYMQRAGGNIAMWRERMRAETWLNAQEALALKLVDEVAGNPLEPDAKPKSEWDLTVFAYAGREHAPAPVLVPVAMADGPTDSAPEATDTPAAEAVADEMPVDAQVEAVTEQAGQPADGEATAEVETGASAVEPLATAPTPEPVIAQASAWATPAWLDTPADPWQSLVAGLTNTEPSTADDQLASAQEANK